MRRLLLLPLLVLGCPKQAEPVDAPSGPPPTTTAPMKELPKFELGQLKSDPDIAAKDKAALPLGDAGTTIFDAPCGGPAAVKCKP